MTPEQLIAEVEALDKSATLADYVNAGALDFAHSKASTAARNVQRYVGEAKIWHANKRPSLRNGPAPRKFLGGGR